MEFTEVFKMSGGLCSFSPDGSHVACIVKQKLVVRNRSMQVTSFYNFVDVVSHFEWSPDSQLIFVLISKLNLIQVFKLNEISWKCRINEGSIGVIHAFWAPDSRYILSISHFHLKLTVWCLSQKNVYYINNPKNCRKFYDFSRNENLFALAQRQNCKDFISVFDSENWKPLITFCTETEDLEGLCWSPTEQEICLWESSLKYKILIYDLHGNCLWNYCACENGLGIRSLKFSNEGLFMAVGSYDCVVRVFNCLNRLLVTKFDHDNLILDKCSMVYKEVEEEYISHSFKSTCYKYMAIPLHEEVSLPMVKFSIQGKGEEIKNGISLCFFSKDSKYLASKNELNPNCVFIWSLETLSLASLLIHLHPIKNFQWHPTLPHLAIATGKEMFFIWTPEGAMSVDTPHDKEIKISEICWNFDGNNLCLRNKEQFLICCMK